MAEALKLIIGFELELIAPPQSNRLELAIALAENWGGESRPIFHADAEPSMVPGMGVFHHLTPGFEVLDAVGNARCRLVDDTTLVDDLDPHSASPPGWYRVLTDDTRILRLITRHCDAAARIEDCLDPIARLFGARLERRGEFFRVNDTHGATIAIAAPMTGDRHRPCEVVTMPLANDHFQVLDDILSVARSLGFALPVEAAVHLHFDAELMRDPLAIRSLIRLVLPRQELLRAMLGTNPRCRRLGPFPADLETVVENVGFVDNGWPNARNALLTLGLSKYADLNLSNLLNPPPAKDTVEWRILPGSLHAEPVIAGAKLLEAVMLRARRSPEPKRLDGPVEPTPESAKALEQELSIGI